MYLSMVIGFLRDTNEKVVAEQVLDAFAKYANSLEQYDELAKLYQDLTAYTKCEQMLKLCLGAANAQQAFAVRANLAKTYNHMNEPKLSLQQTDLNLMIDPNNFEAKMEQSFSYYLLGDAKRSWEIQEECLNDPNCPEKVAKRIKFNSGTYLMMDGKFKEGMRRMIIGGKRDVGIWKTPEFAFPEWDGSHTEKTIVVYGESGIGDEIMNVRFLNHIKARGMNVVWYGTRGDTSQLFETSGFSVVRNLIELDPRKEYVAMDSTRLPVLLDLDMADVYTGAYIKTTQARIDKWKKILPEEFITVRWSGNPVYDHDLHRTLDKPLLLNTLEGFGMPIVSLQIDAGKDQPGLIVPDVTDWLDTVAIQLLAKVNITSCTSTAHSAGASGAHVMVLPPICTYYPWLNLKDDNTSWWYGDNVKVYPQTKHRDWSGPIEAMKSQLIKGGLKWQPVSKKTA